MIRAWRIDKSKRSKGEAFSGEGARLYPGRWNTSAHGAIYAASSLSLAALERLVHMGDEAGSIAFVSYTIAIPTRLAVTAWTLADMPPDWRDQPAPASTRAKGSAWLASRKAAVLVLPSVVTPGEHNVLLNPAHPDFKMIRVGDAEPYSFDPRLRRDS